MLLEAKVIDQVTVHCIQVFLDIFAKSGWPPPSHPMFESSPTPHRLLHVLRDGLRFRRPDKGGAHCVRLPTFF